MSAPPRNEGSRVDDRDSADQIGLQARTLEPILAHILGPEASRVPDCLLSQNGVAIVAACRS